MTVTNTIFSTLVVAGLSVATVVGAGEAVADPASSATLSLDVSNVEEIDGNLMIALFKGEDSWKSNDAAEGKMVPVTSETMSISFDGLKPGEYGIKIFHDVNSDGELNLGNFGIPSEPYAFSNDAPVNFGPPSWTSAHFTIADGDNSHTVTLK